jgi:sarcosine oxidase subunit beta
MRVGVIGGGVYGTAIAYFLKRFDVEDVILFEKDAIGGLSTSKSAGIVRQHYSHEIQIRIAKRGRDLLAVFDDLVEQECGFHQNGYLIMANEGNADQFREIVEMQQRAGVEVESVSPDQLTEHVPGIDDSGIEVAALEPSGGFADPYLTASGFAKKAQELGADIRSNTPVTDIEVESGTVKAVLTPGDRVEVDVLVNAAGPYGSEIGLMAGVEIPLKRHEAKIMVLESDSQFGPERPVVSDIGDGIYVKPEPSGDFILGGVEREGGHRVIDDEADLRGVTNDDLRQASAFLDHRLPGYSDARVAETWSGIITATPDWYQIVGVPDGYENLYNMVGGSGHGFKEAPAFAEDVARDILGEEPVHELEPYRLERFDEDDLLSDLEKARKDE